jgi:hypothetical protein
VVCAAAGEWGRPWMTIRWQRVSPSRSIPSLLEMEA